MRAGPTASAVLAAAFAGFAWTTIASAQPLPKPEPVEPPPSHRIRFVADPITDGAVLSASVGFAGLLDIIIGTEELLPQQPQETDQLIGIDEAAVRQTPSPTARLLSNVGIGVAGAYAVGDTVYTGATEGTEAGLVDFVIYAESASITWALTNLAKLAVRRPRPSAYRERDERREQGLPETIEGTNTALSFFSGHASITAALSTTATYLAFSRSESLLRGYLTLAGGTTVTTLVCWGRVRGGVHHRRDRWRDGSIGVRRWCPTCREEEPSSADLDRGAGRFRLGFRLTLNGLL
jgi:undecaprenyl-diphosphatase